MTPEELLAAFAKAATAVSDAVAGVDGPARRARTDRPGQYAIDLVADAAALGVLGEIGVAVVSEESGRSGPPDAAVTVVLDPVDGSTNCARGIPYWAVSICALDADGLVCSLVANPPTGVVTTAVRGGGAWRDGRRLESSATQRVEDSVVALSALPGRVLPWRQLRMLGSAALALCDVAAGGIDGYVDGGRWHAPWDYLGGLLACREAGAVVVDADEWPLEVSDPSARRQLIAAGTPELLAALRAAVAA